MRDASLIIFLVILGNALLLGTAAVRYMCTEGAPLAVKHRLWINFVSYLLLSLLVLWALRNDYNHRQLWLTGGYEFTARAIDRFGYYVLWPLIMTSVSLVIPNALMFGFWSGNGRVVYTTIASFIVWHIIIGVIGYLMFSQLFTPRGGLSA